MNPPLHEIRGAKPYPFRFPSAAVALVMIDMQRDFLDPTGFGAALGNDVMLLWPAIAPAQRLLGLFRQHALPIIHTREAHLPDLSDCPPAKRTRGNATLRIGDPGPMGRILISGEVGADIVPELTPEPGEIVLDKPGKGAFYATALNSILKERNVTHLVIAGVTTEVCVQTTMREANDRGYECVLAEDATESYFPAFKAATLAMVRAQGAIVGWTATVEQIAGALSTKTLPAAYRSVRVRPMTKHLVASALLDPATWPGLHWQPLRPGVDAHWLHSNGPDGPAAALLRYEPGATVPTHEHAGAEHILVLSGAQQDAEGEYRAGTLVVNPAGTRHTVASPEGCVVVAIWERPVRFL